jgi:hypothetical protein
MRQLILMALLLVSVSMFPAEAAAQRCGHGYIRRVSMGICVSKRSRLAMGFVKAAHTSRHGRRYQVAAEPLPVLAPDVDPAIVDLPFSIHGSILMQPPPARAFGWLPEPKP